MICHAVEILKPVIKRHQIYKLLLVILTRDRFENFDDDSNFSDSEIEKLDYLDTIIDQDTDQHVFSKEPLPSRSAFHNVILEFLDTPVEVEILKFKS